MNTTRWTDQDEQTHSRIPTRLPETSAAPSTSRAFTRSDTAGPFSLFEYGAIGIETEPGLVIRVHAGCIWVPNGDDHCSVGVGAGESFAVRGAGLLTALATPRTEVELEWPSDIQPAARPTH